jgi:hypothetical protein
MTDNTNIGFSVYIDNQNRKVENNSSKNFLSDDTFESGVNNIYPKYIDKWVDDTLILNCQKCDSSFSRPFYTLSGKHHCRTCGCVFCSSCCHQYIKVPHFIKKPEMTNSYKQLIGNIYKSDESLVCVDCYKKIKNLEKIVVNIIIVEWLDLKSLNNLKLAMKHAKISVANFNKGWYNACIHYLSKFREIQYKSNNVLYTQWEYNIMKQSFKTLFQHSSWKIHLIKSEIQNSFEKNLATNDLFTNMSLSMQKKQTCWTLMCSRKCNLELDVLDYVEILKFVSILDINKNKFWENEYIKTFLLNILKNICHTANDINLIIIKNAIPLLCASLISLLNDFIENIDIDFVKRILDEFTIYPETMYYLYDEIQYLLSIHQKHDNGMGISNLSDILEKYLGKNIDLYRKKIKYMKEIMTNFVDDLNEFDIVFPILYPLDYNWNIIKINNSTKMESNSCPIVLDVTIMNSLKESKNVKFLIKKESTLRKEQLVSCVISLLTFRLKQHEIIAGKFTESSPIYQIKMLTSDVGVIEYVENSKTLRQISMMNVTLQNYILEKNLNEITLETKTRFYKSLSTACCLSYLLGLGDRHLDNIMINTKGQIFNIDFGYLLENPKTNILGAPNIKVTTDMIDFLGGNKSEYYNKFKDYLIYIYDIMRMYKNIIVNYYEIIGDEKLINWTIFKDKLESRLMNGLVFRDIQIVFMNEIESSDKSFSGWFNDICHQLAVSMKKK